MRIAQGLGDEHGRLEVEAHAAEFLRDARAEEAKLAAEAEVVAIQQEMERVQQEMTRMQDAMKVAERKVLMW